MDPAAPEKSVVRHPEPGWIGEVLGTNVTGLEVKRLGECRGLQSTSWRLHLGYSPTAVARPL